MGRLAPTPSGHLHLGNVSSFAAAWLSVRQAGGRLLYRVEDVDVGRAREAFVTAHREDLQWLGLDWDHETARQSTRDYAPWLARLPRTYFCQCSRKQIREAGGHPVDCRDRGHREGAVRFAVDAQPTTFVDRCWGPQTVQLTPADDPVLRRRDGVFAYNLAVTADDIADGVTEVVRGADLLEQSAVQIQLWRALEAEPPTWMHARLVVGPDGRKLAKSHGSVEVRQLREQGSTPEDIWRQVLPWLGLPAAAHPGEVVQQWTPTMPREPVVFG